MALAVLLPAVDLILRNDNLLLLRVVHFFPFSGSVLQIKPCGCLINAYRHYCAEKLACLCL
jgi:hypothetical protein